LLNYLSDCKYFHEIMGLIYIVGKALAMLQLVSEHVALRQNRERVQALRKSIVYWI